MTVLSDTTSDGYFFDVVGVGALNVDYIASASVLHNQQAAESLTSRLSAILEKNGPPLEWGTERCVDGDTIHAAINAVDSTYLEAEFGGSAFNTINALAHTRTGLRLGYVGVAGQAPALDISSIQQFEALGVDHQFVFQDKKHLCGVCFSFSEDGDRTLLTHIGANDYMADHLDHKFDDIVNYLASTKVIHVTSFLDDRTADRLLAILREVKKISPETLLCIDPGHVWSTNPSKDVLGLIAISDYLLVNHRELCALGNAQPQDTADDIVMRLMEHLPNHSTLFVKTPTGISSHRIEHGKLRADLYPQEPLKTTEIQDATGAGDVFAAGLLTALTHNQQHIELGCRVGMKLARHKLRHIGSSGHPQFAEITHSLVEGQQNNETANL